MKHKNLIYKTLAFVFILIVSPLLGAIYGVIHDQFTYSVSEEYYTKFKFIQFGLYDWGLGTNIGSETHPEIKLENPRLGAAIVGSLATWWMGLIIGSVLGMVSLIHRNAKEMLKAAFIAIFWTIVIALLTGLLGLFYGKLFLLKSPPSWRLPEGLVDQDAYIMVGSMHNFSYLGGLIGLIAGVFIIIWYKRKYRSANVTVH